MTMLRVVKVGGSLLEMNELEMRLRNWLSGQSPAHHVVVVGGGLLVDEIRNWHQRWPLADEVAHWICVDQMTTTAQLLRSRMPELVVTEDQQHLQRRVAEPGSTVFSPGRWLRNQEATMSGTALEASWETTSDSIAARLAVTLQADELVLLKSALSEDVARRGIAALAETGMVDPMLCRLFDELSEVRVVNLRSDPPCEVSIPSSAPSLETL